MGHAHGYLRKTCVLMDVMNSFYMFLVVSLAEARPEQMGKPSQRRLSTEQSPAAAAFGAGGGKEEDLGFEEQAWRECLSVGK